ncbi:hypothetical protein [Ferrimicrobium sp.]|nr:hypothetical protein [Ferrimicrobium sp.]
MITITPSFSGVPTYEKADAVAELLHCHKQYLIVYAPELKVNELKDVAR